jgi:hypothetical protein
VTIEYKYLFLHLLQKFVDSVSHIPHCASEIVLNPEACAVADKPTGNPP